MQRALLTLLKGNMVAGKDESSERRDPVSLPSSPSKPSVAYAWPNESQSELSHAVSSIMSGEARGVDYTGVIIPDNHSAGTHVTSDPTNDDGSATANIEKDVDFSSDPKFGPDPSQPRILEYCPIRHRAGIERLLQVIEGREPRLDSATKVWTLAVLGRYFDCTEKAVRSFPPST